MEMTDEADLEADDVGDLEIARAIDGDNVRYAEVDDPLDAMERFLRDKLSEAGGRA